MAVVTVLSGHHSIETAYLVSDYPYGRTVRCRIRYWMERDAKKGVRFCSQTENPRTMRWNAPKKSTYTLGAGAMYLNEEGHVHCMRVGAYSKPETFLAFVRAFPGEVQALRDAFMVAAAGCRYASAMATGKAHWTINGVAQEESSETLATFAREAAEWREVMHACKDACRGESMLALDDSAEVSTH